MPTTHKTPANDATNGAGAPCGYPAITYNTNACGERTTGRVPAAVLRAMPFEDGPGVVLTYLVTIGGRFYALGNLEVAYDDPTWERDGLPSQEKLQAACRAAVDTMRAAAEPDAIVFPLDHEDMPARWRYFGSCSGSRRRHPRFGTRQVGEGVRRLRARRWQADVMVRLEQGCRGRRAEVVATRCPEVANLSGG